MSSEISFEADTPDEALLKMGLYFFAQMESRPQLSVIETDDPEAQAVTLDVIDIMTMDLDVITHENSSGNVYMAAKEVFRPPEMLQ